MRAFSLLHLSGTALFGALAGYALGLPLLRARAQRGDYLWGHYGLQELYVGVPALVVAVVLAALWLVPALRRRQAALRAVLAVGSAMVAIAAFDLGYALLVRGAIRPHYWLDFAHVSRADNVPDPELGFRRKPDTVWTGAVPQVGRVISYRVDSKGFRNPPGVDRAELAFVGDSYTEAAQVDEADTFVQRVGRLTGSSVVNLGRGAYGPQQERLIIERYALGYEPDVVVWQLFDGNDLGDAQQYAAWRAGEVREVPLSKRYFANSLFHPLLEATYESKRGKYAKLLRDDGTELPVTIRYRWMPDQTESRPQGWRQTAAAIREGVALCREAGVEVVIVLVPVAARVLRDRLTFDDPADRARYIPDDPETPSDVGTELAGLCGELGVDLIDLYPRFRAAAASRADGIYIPSDEHLDVRGHELVAEAVAEWLHSAR